MPHPDIVQGAHLSANVTTTTTTPANVTGMSFNIGANEVWQFDAYLKVGTSSNAGTKYAVRGRAARLASTKAISSPASSRPRMLRRLNSLRMMRGQTRRSIRKECDGHLRLKRFLFSVTSDYEAGRIATEDLWDWLCDRADEMLASGDDDVRRIAGSLRLLVCECADGVVTEEQARSEAGALLARGDRTVSMEITAEPPLVRLSVAGNGIRTQFGRWRESVTDLVQGKSTVGR